MKASHYLLASIFLVSILAGCGQKENDKSVKEQPSGTTHPVKINLPEKYRLLLRNEMREIQVAMQRLVPMITQGQTKPATQLAEQIHTSFILKQSLSPGELKELVTLLPKDFVQLDRAFHADAKQLAEASARSDFKTSGDIYGRMINGCIHCHSTFASEQFPNLQPTIH